MVIMTRRRSAIIDITECHRIALSRLFRWFLAFAIMRLAPERGASQNEALGTFKVARCVSSFPFSNRASTETVRCAGADDKFTRGQVVLPKSHHLTVVDPADVPLLQCSTNASRHAGSSDVSRRGGVTLLNFESFRGVSRRRCSAVSTYLDSYRTSPCRFLPTHCVSYLVWRPNDSVKLCK